MDWNDCDLLKVRYIGNYYSVRFSKDKQYFAQRDLEYGMLRLKDDFGEEGLFMPDEFEVTKILKNGGLPDDEEDYQGIGF